MSEEKTNIILIFGKVGIPKSVFYSVLSAMILGALSLSFAFVKTTSQTNNDFPDEKAKVIEAEKEQKSQRIDIEVIKTKVSNTDSKVEDLKSDVRDGFKRIEQRLSEMSGQNKTIIQQTK